MEPAPIPARTTDPDLLDRVRDWRDGEAWAGSSGITTPNSARSAGATA